jgi:hypothetical protein
MGYPFGSGVMLATPLGANQTPVRFGIMQDVTLEFKQTTKKLFGTYRLPVDVAGGTMEITGKTKFAKISGLLFASLFFNISTAVGQLKVADGEAGTIPTTPFAVTVANSTVWGYDLGVVYTSGAKIGQQLVPVATGPITGQYTVAAGVYTFAAADTGLGVAITYTYRPATSGLKLVIPNQLLGFVPRFQINLYVNSAGSLTEQFDLQLNSNTPSKLSFPTKLEDYMIPDFEFEAFADTNNNLGEIGTAA